MWFAILAVGYGLWRGRTALMLAVVPREVWTWALGAGITFATVMAAVVVVEVSGGASRTTLLMVIVAFAVLAGMIGLLVGHVVARRRP